MFWTYDEEEAVITLRDGITGDRKRILAVVRIRGNSKKRLFKEDLKHPETYLKKINDAPVGQLRSIVKIEFGRRGRHG